MRGREWKAERGGDLFGRGKRLFLLGDEGQDGDGAIQRPVIGDFSFIGHDVFLLGCIGAARMLSHILSAVMPRFKRRNPVFFLTPPLRRAARSLPAIPPRRVPSALAALARAWLSWAACLGSRVKMSGSASAVSILAMMPLMRSISASASAIRCFAGFFRSALMRVCWLRRSVVLATLALRARARSRDDSTSRR